MDEFLSFRKMITPIVIAALFWVGVALSLLTALGYMLAGGWGLLKGLLWLVVGPLMVRIYCELLMLLFRIYEEIVVIRVALSPNANMPTFGYGLPMSPPAQAPTTPNPSTVIPPQV
ncbi:MAG: DUF4282 domain-containing protein [Planctomycetota bacterium]|nr:DUF4282 domain-containing protein [Planctomycetota bacterium]